MKKVIVLSLSIFTLTFCSKNSDNPSTEPEPIIGKWIVLKKNGLKPDDCFAKSSLTFKIDKTSISDTFNLDQEENCNQRTINAIWSKTNDKKYKVEFQGKEEILNPVFKENNTIMDLYGITWKKQ